MSTDPPIVPATNPDPGTHVRHVALLRGINVGKGSRIAMEDLRAATEAVGCTDVRTVLATGNVAFSDDRPASRLRELLESAYSERFAYTAIVQVLPMDAVAAAAESYPFTELDDHHDYVVFVDDASVTSQLAAAMAQVVAAGIADGSVAETELVAEGPGCVYWRVPKGNTLSSPTGRALDRAAFRAHVTNRNLRTVRSITTKG